MIKNYKKYIFMFIFLIIIILLTFFSIFDKNSLGEILDNLKVLDMRYIVICFVMIILYFMLQGIYMKVILKSLNKKITLKKGIFYSLVEFFYSGITPSSTGGQPVQLYYMTKDKIPTRKSYITLMLNTIYFKLIVLILGILVIVFHSDYIFMNSSFSIVFFILGFLTDLTIVLLGILFIFHKKLIRKTLKFIFKFCGKFKFLKKKLENVLIDDVMKQYNDEILYIKNNKKLVFLSFILTFIQRLLLFSNIYIIYRALGFNTYSYFDLLLIQASVQVAIEVLPLPGGTGLSEGMLKNIFATLFGVASANTAMLLTRTFSFYIPLLGSGIVILLYNIYKKYKKI